MPGGATVKAASVSTLARSRAIVDALKPHIFILLRKCLFDGDDEVRLDDHCGPIKFVILAKSMSQSTFHSLEKHLISPLCYRLGGLGLGCRSGYSKLPFRRISIRNRRPLSWELGIWRNTVDWMVVGWAQGVVLFEMQVVWWEIFKTGFLSLGHIGISIPGYTSGHVIASYRFVLKHLISILLTCGISFLLKFIVLTYVLVYLRWA